MDYEDWSIEEEPVEKNYVQWYMRECVISLRRNGIWWVPNGIQPKHWCALQDKILLFSGLQIITYVDSVRCVKVYAQKWQIPSS